MASPMLTRVPKVAGPMVAAIIRTIFVPRGKRDLVGAQFDEVVTMLARSHPTVADMLDDAREDLLAFAEFPPTHCGRSGPPTPSNDSTRRSNAAPTSSAYSPTPPHYYACPDTS
jgi:putative transposase